MNAAEYLYVNETQLERIAIKAFKILAILAVLAIPYSIFSETAKLTQTQPEQVQKSITASLN
ncbi:MAG: hypothetical protein COT74_10940 [Bdellovibrionales bacterium CG10_big_fil_rev_8_21_14_0_10_45_34]|nr:MAG: hypothetical protein COT74_10940 [Bdellovibrionales bacterium CG10_big_fil_rev_8_21_14_0_10_45_34]